MQFSTLISSLAILAISQLATAGALIPRSSAEVADHTIGVATFSGIYNGHEYSMEGGIQSVSDRLLALFGPIDSTHTAEAVVGRAAMNKDTVLCTPVAGQPWEPATYDGTNAGIAELTKIGGKIGIKGRQCGVLACYADSGILLCNDNTYYIEPSLVYVASYAQDLVNQCTAKPDPNNSFTWLPGGQEFDTDNYNIIVRAHECPRRDL